MDNAINSLKSIFQVIAFCWSYSQRVSKGKIWLLLFYGIYLSIHPVIASFFVKLILDNLTQIGQLSTKTVVFNVTSLLFLSFLLDSWQQFAFRYQLVLNRIIQRKLVSTVEIDLAYKHASLPVKVIEDAKFLDDYALVKRESGVRIFPIVNDSVNLIATGIGCTLSAVIVFKYGPLYLLILLVTLLPRIYINLGAVGQVMYAASLSAKFSRMWSLYEDFLEGSKGIYESRILGIKEYVRRRLFGLQKDTIGVYEQTELGLVKPRVIGSVIPMAGVFVVSYLFLRKVIDGLFTIGDWQLMFTTSLGLVNQTKGFIDAGGNLHESSLFVENLVRVLNWPEKEEEGDKDAEFENIETIEFKNVSFRYPNMNKDALTDVSFTIKGTENVAIVGHNGAGKTTLVKLLCRFYKPTSGSILVNGQNKIGRASCRERV